jgi:hypothetical protein
MDHIARDSLDALLAVVELAAAVVTGVGAISGSVQRNDGPGFAIARGHPKLVDGVPFRDSALAGRAARHETAGGRGARVVSSPGSERERRVA